MGAPAERACGVELFERHRADVYRWALRLLGRHHDALDVVQDVFLRWTGESAGVRPESLRAWLRAVTVNRCIDVIRSQRAARHREDAAERVTPAAPAREAADLAALRGDVAAALATLTDRQRGVLVAKVHDELTFAEIAAEMEMSVPTAKTHYLRALERVRDRLAGRWDEGA